MLTYIVYLRIIMPLPITQVQYIQERKRERDIYIYTYIHTYIHTLYIYVYIYKLLSWMIWLLDVAWPGFPIPFIPKAEEWKQSTHLVPLAMSADAAPLVFRWPIEALKSIQCGAPKRGVEIHTMWGPQTIAKLVQITPIAMVYDTWNIL